jgi:hypothetical protein
MFWIDSHCFRRQCQRLQRSPKRSLWTGVGSPRGTEFALQVQIEGGKIMSQARTTIVDLRRTSPTLDIGILASRMSLILERFIGIDDYRVPGDELLNQGIVLFQKAQSAVAGASSNGNGSASLLESQLISDALERSKSDGYLSQDSSPHQFCDEAITTLKFLLTDPGRVPRKKKEELSSFFTVLERLTRTGAAYSNS